jgi:hypothetical protein
MSTLNEFISAIKVSGLAKPSKFEVTIAKPKVLKDTQYKEDSNWRTMLLYCEQASLPGLSYTSTQSRTFGEYREIPYERIFDPLQLTFYCDRDMWIKGFFDSWASNIQNTKTRTFSYYKDYTVDMTVVTLDSENNRTYGVKLFECYPKQISAIQLSYEAKDVMRLQVQMQYRYYEILNFGKAAVAQKQSAIESDPALSPGEVIIPQVAANISPSSQSRQSSESEYVREMRARGLDPADPDGSLRLGVRGNSI